MKKLLIIILILGAALGVFVYTRQGKQIEQPSLEATPTANEVLGARRIEVTGTDVTFDKKEIRVKKGEKVAVLFKNSGGTHSFVIDELRVQTSIINSGQEALVNIPTDKTGTYEYYCSFDGHKVLGMAGKLIIEE